MRSFDKLDLAKSIPSVFARVAIAGLASFLISDTIVLAIFDETISQRLSLNLHQRMTDIVSDYQIRRSKMEDQMNELIEQSKAYIIAPNEDSVFLLRKQIQSALEAREREIGGLGITKKEGDGPVAQAISDRIKSLELQLATEMEKQKNTAHIIETKQAILTDQIRTQIEEKKKAMAALDASLTEQKYAVEKTFSDDLAARHRALQSICDENAWIATRVYLIMILLLLIDLLPLLSKIFMPSDEYEFRLATEKARVESLEVSHTRSIQTTQPFLQKSIESQLRFKVQERETANLIDHYFNILSLSADGHEKSLDTLRKAINLMAAQRDLEEKAKGMQSPIISSVDSMAKNYAKQYAEFLDFLTNLIEKVSRGNGYRKQNQSFTPNVDNQNPMN